MSRLKKIRTRVKTQPNPGPWTINDLQPPPTKPKRTRQRITPTQRKRLKRRREFLTTLPQVEEPTFPWMRTPEEFISTHGKTLLAAQEVLVTYDRPEDITKLAVGCVYVETIRCETAYDRLMDWLKEKFVELKEAGKETFHLYGLQRDHFRFHLGRGEMRDEIRGFAGAIDAMNELGDAFRMINFGEIGTITGIDASDTVIFTTSGTAAADHNLHISSGSNDLTIGDQVHVKMEDSNGTGHTHS